MLLNRSLREMEDEKTDTIAQLQRELKRKKGHDVDYNNYVPWLQLGE